MARATMIFVIAVLIGLVLGGAALRPVLTLGGFVLTGVALLAALTRVCEAIPWRRAARPLIDAGNAVIRTRRMVAAAAIFVLVASWLVIDSIPKVARLYQAHDRCGSWTGSCRRG